MKNAVLFALFLSGFFPQTPAPAAANDAAKLVQSVLDKLAPPKWYGTFDFTNFRTDGSRHDYVISIKSRDIQTVRVTFLAPKQDKGREILNKNGEIWGFLPDSRKIIKLADRDSIAGGDFNNADVMKLNWVEDYDAKIVKETKKQWILDLDKKTGHNSTYHKIRLWIQKSNKQPVQQFFYDNAGHHLKTLKYRKIKTFSGIQRPAQLVMENVITGQRTLLKVGSFGIAKESPKGFFKPDNLGK